jgi:hypothetical protein
MASARTMFIEIYVLRRVMSVLFVSVPFFILFPRVS